MEKPLLVNQYVEFDTLVKLIKSCHLGEDDLVEMITWDYDYESLWHSRFWKKKKFTDLSREHQISVLSGRTYWYKRLKPLVKLLLKRLITDKKGVLKLKEITHVADGVVISLLLGLPELLISSEDPYGVTDQIINSIISNCLFNYDKVVKDIKAFRKHVKKCSFEGREITLTPTMRDHTWMVSVVNELNKLGPRNSKSFMFRIGLICQTRATGLGGKRMVNESLSELLSETIKRKEFHPDDLLINCIESTIDDAIIGFTGKIFNFRTSMSTSACREYSRNEEGKFGLLKALVSQGIVRNDKFEECFATGNKSRLGTDLWEHSMSVLRHRRSEAIQTNFAGIREAGKVRAVLSGSGYKDAALQPFSHLTIEVSKSIPELKNAFTARRLGYQALSELSYPGFQHSTFFLHYQQFGYGLEDMYIYSTDWRRATDTPSFDSGRLIMSTFFRKLGFSEDIIDTIMDVWANSRPIFRNGKQVGVLECGQQMGDPITKTNLCLSHPIIKRYARAKLIVEFENHDELKTVKFGNGDDDVEFILCKDRAMLIRYLYWLEYATNLIGYQISAEDTFCGKWGTYCEEVFSIPFVSVRTASKMRQTIHNPYLDIPKIRLLLDVKKDRSDFSSDPMGKVTMLGTDCEYMNRDGTMFLTNLYSISSAIQDVSLGLRFSRVPVYLPKQILGIGKMVPFWDHDSLFLSIKSTRNPFAKWCTLTIMNEYISNQFNIMERRSAVLKDQKHFTKEGIIEYTDLPDDYFLKQFILVKETEWDYYPAGVLEKLIERGRLIPESEIRTFYLFCKRLESLEQEVQSADLFKTIRETIFEPSTEKVFSDERAKEICKQFCDRYKTCSYRLKYMKHQNLYDVEVRTVMDIYHPMRVDLEVPNLRKNEKRPFSTDDDYIDDLFEWFTKNREAVESGLESISLGIDLRQYLEDDILIAQDISVSPHRLFAVITDDIKLINKLNNLFTPSKAVMRISCRNWIINTGSVETEFLEEIYEDEFTTPVIVIEDTGSTSHFNSELVLQNGKYYHMQTPTIKWTEPIDRPISGRWIEVRRDKVDDPVNLLEIPKLYRRSCNSIYSLVGKFL